MKIGTKQLGHEVAAVLYQFLSGCGDGQASGKGDKHVLKGRDEDVTQRDDILVPQVLEQLQLSVRSLGQNRGAERLHDLLDGDILSSELIFGGAIQQ